MNSHPALTLLNISLSIWCVSKCRRTNFFASGFRVVSSTKSRMSIRSFWSSLQKVSCLVWAENLEGTQYSETALWVNANFGGVGFIYLYKYFTCRRDSRLMHWPLPLLCFPCHIHMPHLGLSVGFKDPEISAVRGLENGHVLIFYSFCACFSKPSQSVVFSKGLFRMGFYVVPFKIIYTEFESLTKIKTHSSLYSIRELLTWDVKVPSVSPSSRLQKCCGVVVTLQKLLLNLMGGSVLVSPCQRMWE